MLALGDAGHVEDPVRWHYTTDATADNQRIPIGIDLGARSDRRGSNRARPGSAGDDKGHDHLARLDPHWTRVVTGHRAVRSKAVQPHFVVADREVGYRQRLVGRDGLRHAAINADVVSVEVPIGVWLRRSDGDDESSIQGSGRFS